MRRDEVTALKEGKLQLINEMRSLESAANTNADNSESHEWTSEDTEKFEKLETEVRSINTKLERAARIDSAQSESHSVSVAIASESPKSLAEYRSVNGISRPQDDPEVVAATYNYWLKGDPRGLSSEEYRVLSRASGAVGNYLVPTGFENEIVRALRWQGSFAGLAKDIVTATGENLQVPVNPTHGTAQWLAESGSFAGIASDEVFGQVTLGAYKASCKLIMSEELIQDSAFPLESYLATEIGERISVLAETAFIKGDGSGKPTGITDGTAGCTTYTLPTGQVAASTYEALVGVVFQLPPQYRAGASFIISDAMASRLYLLEDSQHRPLWNVAISQSGPDTFLGYPIYTHPDLATPGANAISMVFANVPKAYWVRRVDGVSLQWQMELHSDSGQRGARSWLRMDGQVVLPDAGRVVKFAAT